MEGNKTSFLGRTVLGLLLSGIISFGAAQQKFTYTYWHGDPTILEPTTTAQRAGHFHTDYLVKKQSSAPDARGIAFGPSLSRAKAAHGPQVSQPGTNFYIPADIHLAYGIPLTEVANPGAIAIVDAFDLSTALADFNAFSKEFQLPQESSTTSTAATNQVFQQVYAAGTAPTTNAGWNGEEDLDIEWAHAMAPQAKIYLVEAASDATDDLLTAETVAANLPGVREVSNSWGGGESAQELSFDSAFTSNNKVVFFASAGDEGGVQEWPAESPNVVGVGGTSLFASQFGYIGETAWSGSGGGPSSFEQRPSYQNAISNIVGRSRGCPDCAAIADPNTGVWIYSPGTFGTSTPWGVVGGTSVACPVVAAITNQRGNWTHDSFRELERIYFNLGGPYFRDITVGTAGGFSADVGWDYITGIGSPDGLFPAYSPPKNLPAITAGVYAKTGRSSLTNETDILEAIKAQDVLKWPVTSISTSIGQTAAISINFTMDKPFAALRVVQVNLVGTAPVGTTQQAFAKDLNPADSTYGQYVYLGASPATGTEGTFAVDLESQFVQAGTGLVEMVIRAVQPPHMATGNYTFSIDQVYLSEVTVPAWDVNLPL